MKGKQEIIDNIYMRCNNLLLNQCLHIASKQKSQPTPYWIYLNHVFSDRIISLTHCEGTGSERAHNYKDYPSDSQCFQYAWWTVGALWTFFLK